MPTAVDSLVGILIGFARHLEDDRAYRQSISIRIAPVIPLTSNHREPPLAEIAILEVTGESKKRNHSFESAYHPEKLTAFRRTPRNRPT
ncbi:MAG: hypothetical protein M2R45_05017 [Verrucomicrobia subdivision 3 bacterium]|nr:hypothetical protein [Limisphaerales bacterium]MCS1417656.1 hypothetical protein [Limisphaerales bacterium]